MYIESSGNNFGLGVFCSWERTDINQISNITFYYNRISIQGDFRSMGRFQIQILTKDNVWMTKFIIAKTEQFSNSSTDWTILSLNITDENYGVKFIYDQIDSPHADMCFSNITITHSPFQMNNPNYFKDIFESIPDYRKIVLLIFFIQNDKRLLYEVGFSKTDIKNLNLEFKNILLEEYEDYLDYIKNEEESIIEKILNK